MMSILKHVAAVSISMMAITPVAFSQPPDPVATAPKPVPAKLTEKRYRPQAMDVSPDGKWLAATSMVFQRQGQSEVYSPVGTQVQVWEVASGQKKWGASYEGNANNLVLFAPDSSRLLFTSSLVQAGNTMKPMPHVIQLVEMADSKVTKLELYPGDDVREPFFSPDSRHVLAQQIQAAGSPKRKGRDSYDSWDAATGKLAGPLPEISPSEKVMGFLNGGQTLVTRQGIFVEGIVAGREIKTRSWPELKLLHSVVLENYKPGVALLSADGARVAITNFLPTEESFEINIWNAQTGKFETPLALEAGNHWVDLLGFSRDGQALIGSRRKYRNGTISGREFLSWDVHTGQLQSTPDEELKPGKYMGSLRTLARFSPDGRSYFTTGLEGQIEHRWLSDGALIRSFE